MKVVWGVGMGASSYLAIVVGARLMALRLAQEAAQP
jgi:hypothetical protein